MAVIDQDNFSNISWHSEHAAEPPSAAMPGPSTPTPAHHPRDQHQHQHSPDYPEGDRADGGGRRSDERRRDAEVLECVVSEPHKENDGTKDAYVSYLITTNVRPSIWGAARPVPQQRK